MLHNTANKIICFFAQSIPAFGIIEDIFPITCQRHVQMHTTACYICLGLGHKTRKQPMALCDCLYSQFKCHEIICNRQCLLIFKIYLVLSGCHLMMGSIDLTTHILHRQYNITACVLTGIIRSQVKISGPLSRLQCGIALVISIQQEKLAFRSYLKLISHLLGICNHALQYATRISLVRLLVRTIHVTDNTRYFSLLRTPRKDRKRIQIWIQIHVGFLHTRKSLNR